MHIEIETRKTKTETTRPRGKKRASKVQTDAKRRPNGESSEGAPGRQTRAVHAHDIRQG